MLYSTRYKKAHYRHSPVVSTHSTLDKYFYLAQSAIISPPSFLSLVFDRYFSISFRDRQRSNTARRTSASVPTRGVPRQFLAVRIRPVQKPVRHLAKGRET